MRGGFCRRRLFISLPLTGEVARLWRDGEGGIGTRTEFCRKSEQETPLTHYVGALPWGSLSGRRDVVPYKGKWILFADGSSLAKPRLCPYGARGAGREMRFGLCCMRLVGKNPLLGESKVPLGHPI